jgi:two-component system cell cycle sensor histidine kinase/response regulator CckA
MAVSLRVLIVEDRPADVELMLHQLRQDGFAPEWQCVDTEAGYVAALEAALDEDLDLILADYSLPQFDAKGALRLLQESGLDVPFIVVTGTVSEEAAVACMKQGAADYLLKDRLARLGEAVRRALGEKELRDQHSRLEEQMRQREKLAAVGQLAGGIAHDFNNYLTTIMLYAQLLLKRPHLPADLEPMVETILSQSRQAAKLVQQILDFSRRSVMETRPIDLSPLVEGIASILQRTLPDDIRIRTEIGSEGCIASVDPSRIQQVVMNLALNARDAMDRGGELVLGLHIVEVQEDGEPPEMGMSAGRWVCLSVSDTGTGMTEEVRSHLFEPFFTTKAEGQGTGLGLAQVHGIVKQHAGHITAETNVGQGTTFRIYLPAVERGESQIFSEQALAVPKGKGEVILLVENEESIREASQETLELLGYTVLAAANGLEALEIYRSMARADPKKEGAGIDLVLTDLVMPGMGGRELLQELRGMDSHVKILLMTGHALSETLGELTETDIPDVVQKPFEVNALAEAVRRALSAGAST